jgi:hypothetical protein
MMLSIVCNKRDYDKTVHYPSTFQKKICLVDLPERHSSDDRKSQVRFGEFSAMADVDYDTSNFNDTWEDCGLSDCLHIGDGKKD